MSSTGGWTLGFGYMSRLWSLWLPALVVASWLGCAIGSLWFSVEGHQIELPSILMPPRLDSGSVGLAGFDALGRSVAERLMAGSATSLMVAVSVVSLSLGFVLCGVCVALPRTQCAQ